MNAMEEPDERLPPGLRSLVSPLAQMNIDSSARQPVRYEDGELFDHYLSNGREFWFAVSRPAFLEPRAVRRS